MYRPWIRGKNAIRDGFTFFNTIKSLETLPKDWLTVTVRETFGIEETREVIFQDKYERYPEIKTTVGAVRVELHRRELKEELHRRLHEHIAHNPEIPLR